MKVSLYYIVLLVICGLIQSGCRAEKSSSQDRLNVLLVTIDTLRADFVGCYGSDVKTPNMDMLAANGVQFMRHITASNCTNPSHASIMTGLYPSVHGVIDNHTRLTGKALTLAEIFKKNGFATLGAVSAGHLNDINSHFGQGFEKFLECEPRELTASERNKLFLKKMKQLMDRPFFAWVHYFDPHGDYVPPPPYDQMYPVGNDYDPIPPRKEMNLSPEQKKGLVDPDVVIPLYKGEITYVDSQLGKVLELLKMEGVFDNTLIIVVADHGESMTEKEIYFCHNGLYNPVMHVPLIMSLPQKLPKGLKVKSQTGSIDIFPTILDIMEIDYQPSKLDGKSLGQMFRNSEYKNHSFIVSEGTSLGYRAIYRKGYKLIKGYSNPDFIQLYRPWEDYKESSLLKNQVSLIEEMESVLDVWLKAAKGKRLPSKQRKKLDDKTRETLKTLGYID